MKECVVFDTNFAISKRDEFTRIIRTIQKSFDVYVPEIVIQEIKDQRARNKKEEFDKLEEFRKEFSDWADIKIKKDIETVNIEYDKSLDSYFKYLLKDKIITYDKDTIFSTLLDRVRFKEPPFVNEHNSSDKGFKDTIIWVSLLEFYSTKTYKKLYFITSDKQFLKYKLELCEEFAKTTDCEIVFIDSNNYSNVEKELSLTSIKKEDKEGTESEQSPVESPKYPEIKKQTELTEDFKKYTLDTLEEIFFAYDEDYDGEMRKFKRFEVYDRIDEEKALTVLDNLQNVIDMNTFEMDVEPSLLFDCIKLEVKNFYKVKVTEVSDLKMVYELTKDYDKKVMEAFINSFVTRVNNNFVKRSKVTFNVDEDDLPF